MKSIKVIQILILLLVSVDSLFSQKSLRIELTEEYNHDFVFIKAVENNTNRIFFAEKIGFDRPFVYQSANNNLEVLTLQIMTTSPRYVDKSFKINWKKDTTIRVELEYAQNYRTIRGNLVNYPSELRPSILRAINICVNLHAEYPFDSKDNFKVFDTDLRELYYLFNDIEDLYASINDARCSEEDVRLSYELEQSALEVYRLSRELLELSNKLKSEISGLNYLPPFPYPPPQASSKYLIPIDKLKEYKTYGEIDSKLSSILFACGYVDKSYYSVPGGFAIVTQVEKMHDNGATVEGENRWASTPSFKRGNNLIDYLIRLIGKNEGRFRMMVYWISNEPMLQSNRSYSEKDVIILSDSGSNFLPMEFKKNRVESNTYCSILVYEFFKNELDNKLKFITKSGVPCYDQLKRIGFLKQLGE